MPADARPHTAFWVPGIWEFWRVFLACAVGRLCNNRGQNLGFILLKYDAVVENLNHRSISVGFVTCVFITAAPITKLFARARGGYWRTCAMRDDEPRPVRTNLPTTH
jgi:hypothetical protein